MKKSLLKPLAILSSLAVAIGTLAAFSENVRTLFTNATELLSCISTSDPGMEWLAVVASNLSEGRLVEAESSLVAARREVPEGNKNLRLAELLVQVFASPGYWDSVNEQGLSTMLTELGSLPAHPLKSDAMALISYRLRNKNMSPHDFLNSVGSKLSSPYAKLMAARESCSSNPEWAIKTLRELARSAESTNSCALGIESRLWAAHCLGNSSNWTAAAIELYVTDSLMRVCYTSRGSTLEIRYFGELLKVSRNIEDASTAQRMRSLLDFSAHQSLSDTALNSRASALNAFFWLGTDHLASGRIAEAEAAFENCVSASEYPHREILEHSYPYVYWMARIFRVHSKMVLRTDSSGLSSELIQSVNEFAKLNAKYKGDFDDDEAFGHALIAECEYSRGNLESCHAEWQEAMRLRSAVIEKTGASFHEAEFQRIARVVALPI